MALVVHPHFHRRRSGVTRHVEDIVRALNRQIESRAIGPTLDPETPKIKWREFLPTVWRERVVWHAHRNNELLVGMLLRLMNRRLKVVFTCHTPYRPGRLTRWLAARADRIVSLSRRVEKDIGSQSTIVAHGVDLSRFQPPVDRTSAWKALGMGGRFGVGVVGRIRQNKGQGDLVAAITPLLPIYTEWRAVLVGLARGADRAWAEALRELTRDALLLAGEQRDVERWYQGFTVLVQPSYREAYSLVTLEALASGCCVVATRIESHPDLIEHGRNGFLYEPGDVSALRQILQSLFAHPEHAMRIGLAAAEDARLRLGIDREATKLIAVYRSLSGG